MSWRRSDGAWNSRSSARSGLQGPAWGRSRWAGLMKAACAGWLALLRVGVRLGQVKVGKLGDCHWQYKGRCNNCYCQGYVLLLMTC